MGDEKTRLVLTIEEKLSIFNYKESHPEKSFASIAKIFTEEQKNREANVKKRKQPAITDFFVKKHINKKIEFWIKNVFLSPHAS